MIIIGIAGKKRCGKDSICDAIKAYYKGKKSVQRIAFADALKQEVATATLRTIEYIDANKDNFRLILQGWGTDFRRNLCGDSYWIQRWLNALNESTADIVVVPDVRFINEFECLTRRNAHLWRVHRKLDYKDAHVTETMLEQANVKWETEIDNNGTLTQLEREVETKLQMYIK